MGQAEFIEHAARQRRPRFIKDREQDVFRSHPLMTQALSLGEGVAQDSQHKPHNTCPNEDADRQLWRDGDAQLCAGPIAVSTLFTTAISP